MALLAGRLIGASAGAATAEEPREVSGARLRLTQPARDVLRLTPARGAAYIRVAARLDDPQQEFGCATIRFDFGDGCRSSEQSECGGERADWPLAYSTLPRLHAYYCGREECEYALKVEVLIGDKVRLVDTRRVVLKGASLEP